MVKSLPAMQETQVWSLGQEDPLEKGMATHSSILAWEIPWTEEPGRLQSMGSQRVDTTERPMLLVLLLEKEAADSEFSSVQSFSRVQLFATPWTAACQASLSITNSWSCSYILNSLMIFKTNQPIHVSVGHNLFYPLPSVNIISLGTSGLSQVTELSLRQDWCHFI